jgi:diguanylate cyclase (GGDEF)-like protein
VPRWAEVHIARLPGEGGGPAGFFAQFQDVTDRRRAEAALAHRASHDPLTGLANRHHFLGAVGGALGPSRGPDEDVAVLFIDVDRLKHVNDTFGHAAGDQLLRELSARLVAAVPDAEVARLGGDEFGVVAVVPRGSTDAARGMADRLHRACAPVFAVGEREIRTSLSIGIVCTGEREIDAEDLLRRADAAMYRAKAGGRSTSRFLDETTLASLRAEEELLADLGGALEHDELFLRYQPELDLHTGRIVGVEAYVRWRHPRHGELPAARFITSGDESGHLARIGAWVQREGMAQAARWPVGRDGRRVVTRINVAAHQLAQDRVVVHTRRMLDELGLAPGDICFEVPGTALLNLGEPLARNLSALSALGVHLAINHFGRVDLSLAWLKRLPAGTLKVDRSLVHGLEQDHRDRAIVATIMNLGERLGLEVVAEGVETAGQVAVLASLGAAWPGVPPRPTGGRCRDGTHPGRDRHGLNPLRWPPRTTGRGEGSHGAEPGTAA